MFTITEAAGIQAVNLLFNVTILVAVVKTTRSVARMELKVEMMWEAFSRTILPGEKCKFPGS